MNVYFILDRSGSMSGIKWTNALEGINAYVAGLQKEEIEGNVKIVAFDATNSIELVTLANKSIAYFKPLTEECGIAPRGNTPLYDAAGIIINEALATDTERAAIVILTDGMENASKDYTRTSIKELVKKVQDRGWEVIFLGANFDVESYTLDAGLSKGKFMNFDLTSRNATAYTVGAMANQTVMYARSGQAINLDA